MSNKIEFRSQDLAITETPDGVEVVNIKSNLAFDESFIKEMREAGVQKYFKIDGKFEKEEDVEVKEVEEE